MTEKPIEEQGQELLQPADNEIPIDMATESGRKKRKRNRKKKDRKSFRERVQGLDKKLVKLLKKCVTWKNIALLLSAVTGLHVGLFVISCGIVFVQGYSEILDTAQSIPLPPEMQDLTFKDVAQIAKDSFSHDWEKYNEQGMRELGETALGHTNYSHSTRVSLYLDVPTGVSSDLLYLRLFVDKNRNGDICQGTVCLRLSRPYYKDFEVDAFVEYDFYQVLRDDGSDLYFNYAGDWYHIFIPEEVETVLHDTPDRYYDIFKNYTATQNPLSGGTVMASEVLDGVYPFVLCTLPECPDTIWETVTLYSDGKYIGNVFGGGLANKINLSEFEKLEEQGDSALGFVLDQYVDAGFVNVVFSAYDEVGDIDIPEDVLRAEPFSKNVQQQLSDDIRVFIEEHLVEWRERTNYEYKNEN